eukprot:3377478-Amphidinium_carterae.1
MLACPGGSLSLLTFKKPKSRTLGLPVAPRLGRGPAAGTAVPLGTPPAWTHQVRHIACPEHPLERPPAEEPPEGPPLPSISFALASVL